MTLTHSLTLPAACRPLSPAEADAVLGGADTATDEGSFTTVLSNIENLNAEMIRHGKPIRERMLKLNEIARRQMELFNSHPTVRKLEAEEHHHIEKPEVNENDDLR